MYYDTWGIEETKQTIKIKRFDINYENERYLQDVKLNYGLLQYKWTKNKQKAIKLKSNLIMARNKNKRFYFYNFTFEEIWIDLINNHKEFNYAYYE